VSAFAVFYVGAAVVAFGFLALAWRLLRPSAPAVPDTPEQWGFAPDDARWEDEATEEHHKGLVTIRASATKWGESIGALLGVFALVAFVKGPESFTDVSGTEAEAAALLVVAAAALAAAAVLLAALAAQGIPENVRLLDGWALRTLTAARTRSAAKQLGWSRVLAVCAAMLVLFAVGMTWLAALRERDEAEPAAQRALLINAAGGEVVCGTLTITAGRLTVTPKTGKPRDVAAPSQLSVIERCP
jgi:hypothetical protein